MEPFIAGLFFLLPVLIVVLIHYFGYTETDKSGNIYRRRLFQAQRICLGCGLLIRTAIPTCPWCARGLRKKA
jgi:hypothetical protein